MQTHIDTMEIKSKCHCCLQRLSARDLRTPFTHHGITESYSDMMAECFAINLFLDINAECGICLECVKQLREACHFKLQVLESQAKLRECWGWEQQVIENDTDDAVTCADDEVSSSEVPLVPPNIAGSCEQPSSSEELGIQHDCVEVGDEKADIQPEHVDGDPGRDSGSAAAAHVLKRLEPAVSARGREQLALGCSVRLERLRDHQLKQSVLTGRKTYSCEQCGRFFRNNTVLRRHIQLNHVSSEAVNDTLQKKYSCNFCSFTSQTKLDLLEHNKSEHGVTSYMCADCEYSTSYKKRLQTHLKSHAVQTRSKSIHCSYSSLTTKTGLRPHQLIHDGEESLDCSKYGFKTSWKLSLQSHLRTTHLSQKPSVCSDANFKSKLKHQLKHQRKIHTSTRAKTFHCTYCDYKCCREAHLQAHLRTHTGEKPFHCSLCDYKCNHKSNLQTHLRTHTAGKPFHCSYCDYKCYQKPHLQYHLRTHTGEKPFHCIYCDYKCNMKHHLQAHLRIHTAEKPFHCSYCDFKSKWNTSLQSHMWTHTGEKPFQCSQCDYKCIQRVNLHRHLRKHTGEKPFQCTYCDYKCDQKPHLQAHLSTHTGEK